MMVYCLRLVEKVVARVAHARVPHLRVGVPGVTRKLIIVVNHGLCFTTKTKRGWGDTSGRIACDAQKPFKVIHG